MAAPLRVGLIGFGVAGSVFHAPLIAADLGFRLAVVVTSDAAKRARAESRYPGVEVVASVRDLWDRTDRLDLVVVASPTSTHVPLALDAVGRGLNVVVDKPFAVTVEQGEQLIAAADAAGVVLQVFQNRRWDGDFLTVRRVLDAGELGEVHRFESRFEWWKPTVSPGWKDSSTTAEGAGLVFDLGTHLIDQALQLFGPVSEVHAELDRRRPGAVTDDDTFISLLHENGVRSQLWMSCLAAAAGPRFRISGNRGSYTSYGLDPQESALAAGVHPGDPAFGLVPKERWGTWADAGVTKAVPTEPGRYAEFYRLLADALHGHGELPVDSSGPLEALAVIEAITSR